MLLAVIGVALCLVVYRRLPETRPPEVAAAPPSNLLRIYGQLLGERLFPALLPGHRLRVQHVLPIYQRVIGVVAAQFSALATAYAGVFAATISGYMFGAHLFRRLVLRFEPGSIDHSRHRIERARQPDARGDDHRVAGEWLAIVLPMVVIMVSVGMVIPACQLAVLQPYGAIAGTASGLFFFTPDVADGSQQLGDRAVVRRHLWAVGGDDVAGSALLVISWLTLRKTQCGSGLARDGGVPVN